MSTLNMLDSILNDQFVPGFDAYGGYVDGAIGNQPNASYVTEGFPGAHHLSIALFANHDADCLDIEQGAATAWDFPAWHARQKARGITRPVAYASAYNMDSAVLPMLSGAGIALSSVRLWTAHYGEGEHICGPASCKQLRVNADGTQWTSSAQGRVLDQSLLLANFFGTPKPAPTPASNWTEKIVQALPEVKQGATGNVVRTVQGLCAARGHAVTVDGSFGSLTRAAVVACQKVAGIAEDGIVGQATWVVLVTGSAALSVECSHWAPAPEPPSRRHRGASNTDRTGATWAMVRAASKAAQARQSLAAGAISTTGGGSTLATPRRSARLAAIPMMPSAWLRAAQSVRSVPVTAVRITAAGSGTAIRSRVSSAPRTVPTRSVQSRTAGNPRAVADTVSDTAATSWSTATLFRRKSAHLRSGCVKSAGRSPNRAAGNGTASGTTTGTGSSTQGCSAMKALGRTASCTSTSSNRSPKAWKRGTAATTRRA